MFSIWLKTTFRNLLKHKGFTFINITGLAVGLTCALFIFLWVQDELSINQFHADVDRIWQVKEHQLYSNDVVFTTSSTPGLLAEAFRNEIPEVQHATVFTWEQQRLFGTGPSAIRRDGIYADHDFLNVFGFTFVEGDAVTALIEPNTVVLTKNMADALFPEGNAVGQMILVNETTPHRVTAVLDNIPSQSTIQFEFLLPFDDFAKENAWLSEWGNNGPYSFVKLHPNTDGEALSERLVDFIRIKAPGSQVDVFLQPFTDTYLYSRFANKVVIGGPIDNIRLFVIIAAFVMLIACINFMNLSTARSATRAKEVGVHKSLGASRKHLAIQFMGEAVLMCLVAMIVALILVELLLPGFNELTNKTVRLSYTDPMLWLGLGAIQLISSVLAGLYPALVLSSHDAVVALKGVIHHTLSGLLIRKGLVVLQFSISIFLLVGMMVIYQQVDHMSTQKLGYEKDQLGFVFLEGSLSDENQKKLFRDRVSAIPGVANAGLINNTMVSRNSNTWGVNWPGKAEDVRILFEMFTVDANLPSTAGFEFVAGRDFSEELGDAGQVMLLNEASVRAMGVDNPIDMMVSAWGEERRVIGVVKDFNYTSLHSTVEPMVMIIMPENAYAAAIRLESASMQQTLSAIEAVYKEFNPSYPFTFHFQDERVGQLYQKEQMVGTLSSWFGGVAVLVSCLGLFGLSVFMTEQRVKEISVRKVLGASVSELVMKLTREFTVLVLISIGIALPVSWWVMSGWLNDFTYRIEVSGLTLFIAGFAALLISWLTVSGQSVKAALANPAETLRNE